MRVLLVAGGDIPIPPPCWGGVENLMWQQRCALIKAGHHVDILNVKRQRTRAVIASKPWTYDVVHLHLDSRSKYWVPLSRLFRFNLVVSTHYGYAAFPQHWEKKYRRTFRHMSQAQNLILLTQEIKNVFASLGCKSRMFVLANGIHCSDVHCAEKATKEAIVLGRIQERKKQTLIAQRLDGHTVQCDFVGPPEDPTFAVNDVNTHYLGEWTRAQVHHDLTDYACLVLLSDGEGHAGVVSEAMASGCSLVLSPESSHNLDLSYPWIKIVDRDKDPLGDIIAEVVRDNHKYRAEIRRYCEEHFDWNVILPQYIAILELICKGKKAAHG